MKKILYLLLLILIINGSAYSQTTRVDGNNSILSSALSADSVWNGSYTNLVDKDVSSFTLFIYSDSASASNGLKIYYSDDGVNVRDSLSYSVTASVSQSLLIIPYMEYYRLQYTNGGSASTNTLLQVILRTAAKGF